MEDYIWSYEGEDNRSLSVEDYINVLVDNSWRPYQYKFYDFDIWDFNKTNKE